MKNWLKIHQILLVILLFALFGEGVVYLLFLLPKSDELSELRSDVDSLQDRLRGSKWPLEAEKLERYLAELDKEYKGKGSALTQRSAEALQRANATFLSKITSEYGNQEEFMSNVSRLDYQSEYNRVLTSLGEKNIRLDSAVLNMSEEVPTPYIYQCMVQIWTVEKLVSLALESGLEISAASDRRRSQPPIAKCTVEPMRAYFANPSSERPYLLEFPVTIGVEGPLDLCLAYLDRLCGDGVFMPPKQFEVFAKPPATKEAGEDGNYKSGSLILNLTCSSYMVIGKPNRGDP